MNSSPNVYGKNRMTVLPPVILFSFLFLFLCTWFIRICPLIVFDGDDWTYIAASRSALPLIRAWNPSRILPELLMPLCGSFAAFVLCPILGDYLLSVTVSAALFVSAFILLYLISFYLLLRKLGHSVLSSCAWSVLFFILHYLIFRGAPSDNSFNL